MTCLDAKALETDPEGMAFLRSVLRPDAVEPTPRQALAEPALSAPAMIAPAGARLQARVRRARRTGPCRPVVG